jgi:hypothetical protein
VYSEGGLLIAIVLCIDTLWTSLYKRKLLIAFGRVGPQLGQCVGMRGASKRWVDRGEWAGGAGAKFASYDVGIADGSETKCIGLQAFRMRKHIVRTDTSEGQTGNRRSLGGNVNQNCTSYVRCI